MAQPLILLDLEGDAELPAGYTLVDNEVTFLCLATDKRPLLIRGQRLCDWARDFYHGRNIIVQETQSPTREIQAVVPDLSAQEAHALYRRIGPASFAALDRPLQPLHLLEALYPTRMWLDSPSLSHAAEWLVWLYKQQPDSIIRTLFAPILDGWRLTAAVPERMLYEAADGKTAHEYLRAWFYIAPRPEFAELGEFPYPVPEQLIAEAKKAWAQSIIESQGATFDEIERQPIPVLLRRMAAEETAAYFQQHPRHLTHERYRKLARFLNSAQQDKLTALLPPPPPGELPDSIEEILAWFESEYLPFRLWQARHGDEQAANVAESAARCFSEWYLAQYPKGLMGGPLHEHLSFNQIINSKPEEGITTIVIVLDGLHAEDARQLQLALEQEVPRLTLLEQRWVFAPVPTITRFAKDALLKGRDPGTATGQAYRAPVLPERIDPSHQLAKPGDILVWRVMEPDATYHGRNTFDSLARAVESALNQVAMTISDIIDKVPDELSLRVIITTDHGRLLQRATRTIMVPSGMESHGRAAWGERLHTFDSSGILFEDDIAFLHGERFGLPQEAAEAAVLIGPGMFKTNDNKSGSELYPHGGASPEEVIVPWLVLQRDWKELEIPITISGRGVAGRPGQAHIKAMNINDVKLTIAHIRLRLSDGELRTHDLQLTVKPYDEAEAFIELDSWPTEVQNEGATAVATIRLPAGQQYNLPIKLDLETEEMYRRDNILEDLE